eukprot:2429486-Rhodomonas_salina.3
MIRNGMIYHDLRVHPVTNTRAELTQPIADADACNDVSDADFADRDSRRRNDTPPRYCTCDLTRPTRV